jgi:hypothetical protein
MTRPTNFAHAASKIERLARWAEQQGFHNIAAELHSVLALLPAESSAKPERRRS